MAPHTNIVPTGVLCEDDVDEILRMRSINKNRTTSGNECNKDSKGRNQTKASEVEEDKVPLHIYWFNVVWFILFHIAAIYGAYLAVTEAKWLTVLWAIVLYEAGIVGVTAGAHRLWSHRAYKAKWQLKAILIFLNTIAYQNCVYDWVRDHRVHHKYSETDADPVNSKRGFFFSHMGWLMCRKHPKVIEKGRTIDLSDVEQDPFVSFQRRYYKYIMPMLCFILPTMVPIYFWNESFKCAFYTSTMFRYVTSLNAGWLVNSAAHMWGYKPFDKHIQPVENLCVSVATMGEGWHNYHHTFPWDYKTSELGDYSTNMTCAFIDFFAMLGWAYDLKTVSMDMINKRARRTGDGSRDDSSRLPVWGWGDKDIHPEDVHDVHLISRIPSKLIH